MSKPPPIKHWRSVRNWGLIILAVLCLRLGVAYTPLSKPAEIPFALRYITAFLPIWVFGCIWILLTVVAVVAIWVRKIHDMAFMLAFSLTIYWMLAYVFAQFDPGLDPPYDAVRSWNSAWNYLVIALCIGFIGWVTRLPSERKQQV